MFAIKYRTRKWSRPRPQNVSLGVSTPKCQEKDLRKLIVSCLIHLLAGRSLVVTARASHGKYLPSISKYEKSKNIFIYTRNSSTKPCWLSTGRRSQTCGGDECRKLSPFHSLSFGNERVTFFRENKYFVTPRTLCLSSSNTYCICSKIQTSGIRFNGFAYDQKPSPQSLKWWNKIQENSAFPHENSAG